MIKLHKIPYSLLHRSLLVVTILAVIVAVGACSSTSSNTIEEVEESQGKPVHPLSLNLKDHELVNKIWHIESQAFVDKPTMLQDILSSDYILLGETHDNIEHHNGQIWVISELNKANKKAGIAFEMISQTQAETADINGFTSPDELIKHLETEETGWQYGAYYKQVFDSAMTARYQFYPANMSRQTLMAAMRKNGEELPEHIKRVLDNNPLPELPSESLKEEIIKSHCGVANDGMVKAMILGQRVRDAIMAQTLVDARAKTGLSMILIAGSGHVRTDRAVPMYLKHEDNKARSISIAWLEVDEEARNVEDYTQHWKDGKLPFDYVWFTAQVERPDPCEEMRKMHQKHTEQAKISE